MGDDFVEVACRVPQHVHGEHDALRPETVGTQGDQIRIEHGLRVDAHFVCARAQQGAHLIGCAHTAADGKRDEHFVRGAMQHVDDQPAIFGRRGDVVEDQLVRPLAVVFGGQLHGVADDPVR